MTSMGINGLRKPQMVQNTQPPKKPQGPAPNQGQKPDLSAMYSQVAQNAMKPKPR
jgi:hypothetical protein